MSRSDRGDRERWHGEAVTDEGTGFGLRLLCAEGILPPGTAQDEHFVLIFAFPRTPFTGVTPWAGRKTSGAQNLSECPNSRRATGPFVVAKSAQLRFRLTAKTALAPLLLLSNANPLRWALRWEPPSAAYWVENCRWCGSAAAPGFAEPTCPVQYTGYLIRPLRGHLPLKGKALKAYPPAFPFRGRWHGRRPDG